MVPCGLRLSVVSNFIDQMVTGDVVSILYFLGSSCGENNKK